MFMRKSRNEKGMSLVEVMIAGAIGVGISLYGMRLLEHGPSSMISKSQEKLIRIAGAVGVIDNLTKDINNSQVMKSHLFECDPNTLSDKRSGQMESNKFELKAGEDSALNFVSIVFSDIASTKVEAGYLLPMSPAKFQKGDIVAVYLREQLSRGGVFLVDDILEGKLHLSAGVSIPDGLGCDVNDNSSELEHLKELADLVVVSKIKFVSYYVSDDIRNSSSLFYAYYANSKRNTISRKLLENFEKLAVEETWQPFPGEIAENNEVLGKMTAELKLVYSDIMESGNKRMQKINAQAGYQFSASLKSNKQVTVVADLPDIVSPTCLVSLKELGPGLVFGDQAINFNRYVLVSATMSDVGDALSPSITAQATFLKRERNYSYKQNLVCYKLDGVLPSNLYYQTISLEDTVSGGSLKFIYDSVNNRFPTYICKLPAGQDSTAKIKTYAKATGFFFDANLSTGRSIKCSSAELTLPNLFEQDDRSDILEWSVEGAFSCKKDTGEISSYATLKYNYKGSSTKYYGPPLTPLCKWEGDSDYTDSCHEQVDKKLDSIKIAPVNITSKVMRSNIVRCY